MVNWLVVFSCFRRICLCLAAVAAVYRHRGFWMVCSHFLPGLAWGWGYYNV